MARNWNVIITEEKDSYTPLERIDFGIVLEGEVKEKTLYLRNLEEYRVYNINVSCKNDEVTIRPPSELESMESAPIQFMWVTTPRSIGIKEEIEFTCEMIKTPPE